MLLPSGALQDVLGIHSTTRGQRCGVADSEKRTGCRQGRQRTGLDAMDRLWVSRVLAE